MNQNYYYYYYKTQDLTSVCTASVTDTHRLSFRSLVPLWPWQSHSTFEASFSWGSTLTSQTPLTLDGGKENQMFECVRKVMSCFYVLFNMDPLLLLVQRLPDLLGVLEGQFYHEHQLCQEVQPPHHHHVLPKHIYSESKIMVCKNNLTNYPCIFF